MSPLRKLAAIASLLLAIVGGGWAFLTLMSAYMTSTGLIRQDAVWSAVPLPTLAVLLALAVQFFPRRSSCEGRLPWCVSVYIIAGGPTCMLVFTWLGQ